MYIVRIAIYLGICIKLIQKITSWNWTPEQKNLLIADIPRMIMRSHWSTGKTIILFEKAKVLARKGAFTNYVYKIWLFFDHLPPSVYIFYGM